MAKSKTGPTHIVSVEMVQVRRTQRANGTVSYDGDHNGARWRLSYRANGQTRLHFPTGKMRVVKTWYGREKGQNWTNVDMESQE
jgi:hypothetical protein